jgi:hypothetical protein
MVVRKVYLAILIAITSCYAGLCTEEQAGAVYFQQGITALKASDTDRPKLLVAIGHFTKAAEKFDKEGNEQSATDTNAMLYWCRKKLTIDEIGALQRSAPEAATRAESVVSSAVKPTDAKDWLARADAYANRNTDPLLRAIRYYEVADRFKGTPEGMKALDLSLKLMQDVSTTRGVVGEANKGEGKAFVMSDPAGASVLLESADGLRDTGIKTPGLVLLPTGRSVLVLRLDGCADGRLAIDPPTDTIAKPDAVRLERLKSAVDVTDTHKGGWQVFVDGNPAMNKAGKPAVTPCTILLPEGSCEVTLAKEGFLDVMQPATIKGASMVLEIRVDAVAGKSKLLTGATEFMVGRWIKMDTDTVFEFKNDGSFSAPAAMLRGRWKATNETVTVSFQGGEFVLRIVTSDHITGRWDMRRRKK